MNGAIFQARRGHRLDQPGDPRGVSCDARGPALGPIRLLARTALGFAPRPAEELDAILGRIFERPIDCAALALKLEGVTRALNAGDLPRAMFLTQYLHLPYLSEEEARRAAAAAENMIKASPDDPEHPGWPAGTEGGMGGKFRPNDGGAPEAPAPIIVPAAIAPESPKLLPAPETAKKLVAARLDRIAARRTIRAGLLKLLSGGRLLRLGGEALSTAVPGADVVGDALLIAELADVAKDFVDLKRDYDVTIDFIKKGPYKIDDLRVSIEDEDFRSFDSFKKIEFEKRFGPAGSGYEYHHVVEQGSGHNLPEGLLHSTRNIIRIPKLLHEEISSAYGQRNSESGMTIRDDLRNKGFNEQYERGLEEMRKLGIIE